MRGKRAKSRQTAAEVLVKYDPIFGREDAFRLRRAMMESGLELKCSHCPITTEHNGKLIVLEIDHLNNDWSDNRLENVQFICPNCHSQKTSTDRSKAKYLKQINTPVCIRVDPLSEMSTESTITKEDKSFRDPRQMRLKFYTERPRQTPAGTNWRKLAKPQYHKVPHPSKEELEILIWQKSILQIAKDLGVTDNSVRMWCERYEITNIPPLRYWPRRRAGWSHEEALAPIEHREPLIRKLRDEEVVAILALLREGELSQREIAKRFDTNHPSVSRIKSNQAYKHIPR